MKAPRPASARLRDAAVLLPAIGTFLFLPPAITLFVGGGTIAGVPLIVVYLFGLWLALIAGAALIARRLADPPSPAPAAPAAPPTDDAPARGPAA
ncbi:MAG: hypothetical protein IT522_16215 [Burkholderiales bacterium]|nr:hypothetical protein [Burkholderiales bacterium]